MRALIMELTIYMSPAISVAWSTGTTEMQDGLLLGRPWYLVATINSNGNFVLDNTSYTSFLTQDLPTSDDGKYYIRGGWMNDDYDDFRLEVNHPIYVYKNGAVREWSGYANSDRILEVTGSSATGSGQLQLNCEANTHGVKIKGPPHSAGASYTLTLPNDDGSSGQALTTDGSVGAVLDDRIDEWLQQFKCRHPS